MTTAARERTAVVPATVALPYGPEAAGAARRMVRAKLTEWGLPDLAGDAALVVSELTTNASRTGCQRRMIISVRRIGPGAVRLAVRDCCKELPVLVIVADDQAENGRGLALVHALTAGRWGATLEPCGKTVWAELRMPDVPSDPSRPG